MKSEIEIEKDLLCIKKEEIEIEEFVEPISELDESETEIEIEKDLLCIKKEEIEIEEFVEPISELDESEAFNLLMNWLFSLLIVIVNFSSYLFSLNCEINVKLDL
ncbi:hypothetical protein Avbf_10966 [Armadillidium vulgare]|nr:hypothetical protein Avbf_10966 [Armadillidium vulgare]